MSPELDKQLCEKYPAIFKDRRGDMRKTLMCFGFECGDGWYKIIDTLCGLIKWDVENNRMPNVVAVQVKEKFGTLRFYVDGGNERTDAYIAFAESLSETTCEKCGAEGRLRGGGWLSTLCDMHAGDKPDFHYPTKEDIFGPSGE